MPKRPGELVVADITYISYGGGAYLSLITDAYTWGALCVSHLGSGRALNSYKTGVFRKEYNLPPKVT
ncbi:hypothetical protein PORCAN_414 [Porphyromonas crevioricanis JCM 13913]|nr:hypothetical protein PORCAN_414 [Porphyromonas crevioricanis JCM 13913]